MAATQSISMAHTLEVPDIPAESLRYLMSLYNATDGELFIPIIRFTLRQYPDGEGGQVSAITMQTPTNYEGQVSGRLSDAVTVSIEADGVSRDIFSGSIVRAFKNGSIYTLQAASTTTAPPAKTMSAAKLFAIFSASGAIRYRLPVDPDITPGTTLDTPSGIITVSRVTAYLSPDQKFMEVFEDASG